MKTKNILSLASFAIFGFLFTSPTFADVNITTSPMTFLVGDVSMGAEFGISESISFGPTFKYYSLYRPVSSSSRHIEMVSPGASMTFFMSGRRFTDSWFLSPFVSYLMPVYSSARGVVAGADLGYSWYWSSGFNMGLGVGAQYISAAGNVDSVSVILPSMFLRMGFVF